MTTDKEEFGWIQTYTGRKFDYFLAEPEDVDILDIAHALSMKCQFNGHVKRFYSVAEHCCRVSFMLGKEQQTPEIQFLGLMHDASEAYLPDVPRPLKHLPEMGVYRDIEKSVEILIASKYDLPLFKHPMVEYFEKEVLLRDEMATLMSPLHPDCFHQGGNQLEGRILKQREAKLAFLTRFGQLCKELDRMDLVTFTTHQLIES